MSISVLPNIHYVRTTGSPPSVCPDQPCLTLYQYTQLNNFTDGTVFFFLPGTHSLQNSTLILANVSNITIRGKRETHISCESEIILLCKNVRDLQIEGLNFLFNHYGIMINLIECDDIVIQNTNFLRSIKVLDSYSAIFSRHSVVKILQCVFLCNWEKAVKAMDETNLTVCGSNFTGIGRTFAGGAIYAENSSVLLDGRLPNIFSKNSDRVNGGAIYCFKCILEMSGNNTFYKSSTGLYGGALYVMQGKLVVSGTMYISYSKADFGAAVCMIDSQAIFNGTDIVFRGNLAHFGGIVEIMNSSVTTTTKNLIFIDNIAVYSGYVVRIHSSYSMLKNEEKIILLSGYYINNTGAVHGKYAQITFTDISITGNSRNALFFTRSQITFRGTTTITKSQKSAITAEDSVIIIKDNSIFSKNRGPNGGAINCLLGTISLSGHTLFTQNSADTDGGALYAVGTSIHVQDTVEFTSNVAGRNGGAIYLKTGASLNLKANKSTLFSTRLSTLNNSAQQDGGCMYVIDNPTARQCNYISDNNKNGHKNLPYCFLQAEPYYGGSSITINSRNDTAGRDGNFLYGGLLDRCRVKTIQKRFPLLGGEFIRSITSHKDNNCNSKPYNLCVCNYKECIKTPKIVVYRGQVFTVSLVATAQNGTTSTTVTAITSSKARLEIYQTSQLLPGYCHSLSYTLYSTNNVEQVTLYPDGPCRDDSPASVVINATLLPCPDGFTQNAEVCICDERLHHFDLNCTIDDIPYLTKAAASNFWIDVLYTNITFRGLILGSSCPAEYCKTGAVNITLDNTDVQCDHNHSGLLCGACAVNHSLMLGSSQCRICHNTYLTLLLPFAAAGIALVVFFTFLRLTIAVGSLNSVILYVNIVQVNRELFLPINTRNVLTVFLAWINLDLGFQTCFYDGLDAYIQTWLQFAFPLYVWLLIGVIIIISRYSITVSRLVGHNPIAVFATLILLSYTKILKIIIEVYSSSELEYPDNKTVTVWLKDANVPYLQSKHLLLTVVTSMILVFFFLPYTLLLLLGHQLYRFSGRRYFGWFHRMKPFLDSYYAPYKISTRYWTGFLLIVRCALYTVFMLNSLSTQKSLLAIILTFTAIIFVMGIVYCGRIYQKFHDNVIEGCVFLDLIVLSAMSLADLNSVALAYSLIGLVFILMIAISTYQFFTLYIAKTTLWVWLNERRPQSKREHHDSTDVTHIIKTTHDAAKIVTKTFIELREPLIEN